MGLIRDKIALLRFRFFDKERAQFTCPICMARGPFLDSDAPTGYRLHSRCPACGSGERHRLQHLVVSKLFEGLDTASMSMLHFAPEDFFRRSFAARFGRYETADLRGKGVTHKLDMCAMPLPDASYDVVFASHVLEHIQDDAKAIAEIRRVLKPGGMAILPVPILAETTIEYPVPNPHEHHHVRAPGPDYFDRYRVHFSRIEEFRSDGWPEDYQLYMYQDRMQWPMKDHPLLRPMPGHRHLDIVPVCYV